MKILVARNNKVISPRKNEEQSDRLIASISLGRRLVFQKNDIVFSQGDSADAVFFIHQGKVRMVVSFGGKEATLTVLGKGDFFGICCLGDQTERQNTAITLEPSIITRVEKDSMLRALRGQPRFRDLFLAYLLKRTQTLQTDLCTQILDPCEKRLAKALLKLTELVEDKPEEWVRMPKISHDTLATMVGTTRSRITFFMNKFKEKGYIEYNKGITVRPSQLSKMLQQQDN